MSRYGIDYYGVGYYGSGTTVKFTAAPFTAKPYGYGGIRLQWTSPGGTWAKIRVVRNSYGFPVNAYDGQVLLTAFNGSDTTFLLDTTNLVQGAFYYYSIFVLETVQYTWVRAGDAEGVSVKNYSNANKMYEYLPQIYKISQPYMATTNPDNTDLYNFLSLFGFELDYYQTVTELIVHRYNVETVSGTLIPTMLEQFGLPYEPEVGLQQNRIILRDGIALSQKKGSKAGLRDYIKDFSGYAVPEPISSQKFVAQSDGTYVLQNTNYTIPANPAVDGLVVGHNLMLNYNDSSFEESVGNWLSPDSSAFLSQLDIYSITSASVTSNVATITIGKHTYKVGNNILVSACSLPLFNISSATITAVTATSISYALTSADVTTTPAIGYVSAKPSPWQELTAPALFPNKQTGILAVTNANSSSGAVVLSCGDESPIVEGVPVTAGTNYTFSIYTAAGSSTRSVTAKINWYDRFGVLISTSSGSSVTNSTGEFSSSKRPYVTGIAPTGCWYAVPVVSIASVAASASNEYHYFDAAQFEASPTATEFDEARQIHITVRGQRINELINPNFVSPLTPWTVTGGSTTSITSLQEPISDKYSISTTYITSNVATITLTTPHTLKIGASVYLSNVTGDGVTASKYNGTRVVTAITLNSFSYAVTATDQTTEATTGSVWSAGHALQVTASGSSAVIKSWDDSTHSQLISIYYPDTSYTFSSYAQTASTTETVTASITWYDISYNVLGTNSGSETTVNNTGWSRPYVTTTAPSTAAYASVALTWSTAASSEVIYVDQALFENSGFALDYFDGNGGQADAYDLFWEGGVVNGSRSHFYKNRFVIETRLLTDVIAGLVPMGTTIALYLAQPQT
jgi:hypothetical protein